jgi:hypothetical protein
MDEIRNKTNLSARKVRSFGKNNTIFAKIIFTCETNESNCDDDSRRALFIGCP